LTIWAQILTFARWETKKSLIVPGKKILPHALLLLILLGGATLFSAERGLHLQDGIYAAGTDDPAIAGIVAADDRFRVFLLDRVVLTRNTAAFDLIILDEQVSRADTDRGRAAGAALGQRYDQYRNSVFSSEPDIFAAYPLLIETVPVQSELDFSAAGSGGQVISPVASAGPPVPVGPVAFIPPPEPGPALSPEEFRDGMIRPSGSDNSLFRYSEILGKSGTGSPYQTPSQLSPPLPFDSIVLIFVFIFPLYFISQFLMMSIMNERIDRRGEPLLSAPVSPGVIVAGKSLPYTGAMLAVSLVLCLVIGASPSLMVPLIPVIFFFLASSLIIGMTARSFRELSFISLFFSTVTTVYLFFPSIFADVHVISLISPLTLMIRTLGNEPYTLSQFLFSTSLFLTTSSVLVYAAVVNFREERLFSTGGLLSKGADFIASALRPSHPWLSLFVFGMLAVPFVFMAQMLLLVLVFNLPLPLSLIMLLAAAAAVEEVVKSIGIYSFSTRFSGFLTWKNVLAGAVVTALAFLIAEKLLLLVTISQIAESVFGTVLFSSLSLLWVPFLIHVSGVLISTTALKLGGRAGYLPGLGLATAVHCCANLLLLRGWLW
jgi:ABC-type Na+ efflux pump permease subunit